jgi:hypothetical protein
MKDTAVKFLIDEISCRFIISEELRIAMYKAIAMEKEQISKAYEQGSEDGYWHPENGYSNEFESAEQYYNETFKSE